VPGIICIVYGSLHHLLLPGLNACALVFAAIYIKLQSQACGVMSESSKRFVALDTSAGRVVLELYWKHAPKACYNLASLASKGYYDGVTFHRVIKDFMIQGGDPTGTGRGGQSIYGKPFQDEISNKLKFVGAGILAMANAGKDTNGSQFFLTLAPTPHLDGKHTIFGRVSRGMAVVQRMGLVETDGSDRPLQPLTIYKARPVDTDEETESNNASQSIAIS